MIDTSEFNNEIKQLLDDVNGHLHRCYALVGADMPANVHSQVKGVVQLLDKLLADTAQMTYEIGLALHMKTKRHNIHRKELVEEHWAEFSKNRWAVESYVSGDSQLSDMACTISALDSSLDALTSITWIMKDKKKSVVDLYEKVKH